MADEDETEEVEGEEGDENNVRRLRNQLKKVQKENDDLLAVRRENAFLKAGVNTDTPLGQMFGKAYDGPLEVAAIQAAATEVGVLAVSDSEVTPTEVATAEEQNQTAERNALATGAEPDAGITEDPRETAKKIAERIKQEGGTEERVLAGQFSSLVQAGMSGDKRALVTPQE